MESKLEKRLKEMNNSVSHPGEFGEHMQSIELDGGDSEEEHEDHKVGKFTNQFQFWLSSLGYAVGYGNIWRFPYMLYTNGGGVFFIPFIIGIVVIGYPLFYLEAAYGQLYRKTMHKYFSFNANTGLQAISIGIGAILFFQAILYMGLLAWCFNFLLFSFQSPLPWAITQEQSKEGKFWDENYFEDEFLNISSNVFDINSHVPWIMFSFLVVTILTFATIFKGMDSAKMAVYVIIPLPYLIMTVLFIKGLTLDGNITGWNYLFTADWSKLLTLQIWKDAASQVIFSAGIGMNLIINFSTHKTKDEPILLSSFCIPTMNFLTSIFAAMTLFAFVGHASVKSGVPISEMPISGVELPFVAYPAILATLPFPQFWSVLFFLMLVSIGLGTEYGFVDGGSTIIHGFLHRKPWFKYSKIWVTTGVSILILIIDLVFFASDAGYYWLELFDHYTIGLNLLIFLYIQMLVLAKYLPLEDLEKKVEEYGEKMPPVYKGLIKYLNPVLIAILIIFGIANEFVHPIETPFWGRGLALLVFSCPSVLTLVFYYKNPWKNQAKTLNKIDMLLSD